MNRKSFNAALAAAILLTAGSLASCSSKNDSAKESESDSLTAIEEMVQTVVAAQPTDTAGVYNAKFFSDNTKKSDTASDSTYAVTPSGLKYVVIKEGTGNAPTATDNVTVNYQGTLTDGTIFDSSFGRGEISFPLSGVIKGWTEGLQLMKEGGTTIFYIPSDLAYGPNGTPGGPIGPNADLIFEVQLIKVN